MLGPSSGPPGPWIFSVECRSACLMLTESTYYHCHLQTKVAYVTDMSNRVGIACYKLHATCRRYASCDSSICIGLMMLPRNPPIV